MSDETRQFEILLVEDNPGDVRLTQEALKEGTVDHRLSVCRDGEEAIAFLRKESPYEGAPTPDVILLDLNMPRKDGREVLADVKADPALRHIPVIILTTSDAEEDIVASYKLAANCYVRKPVDLDDFLGIVKAIEQFWTRVALLPHEQGEAA